MVLVNVKELVKASWVLICPKGSKNLGGVCYGEETAAATTGIFKSSGKDSERGTADRVRGPSINGQKGHERDMVYLAADNFLGHLSQNPSKKPYRDALQDDVRSLSLSVCPCLCSSSVAPLRPFQNKNTNPSKIPKPLDKEFRKGIGERGDGRGEKELVRGQRS